MSAPTIMDVARLAGVSMKTVSRVMNNESAVSEKTRNKVKQAAFELNYTPNNAARGLASSKSYLIALIYDIPSPGYAIKIQKGATNACREYGYHLIVEPLESNSPQVEEEISKLISRLRVDGVILAPPLCDNADVVGLLAQKNIPYVPIAPSAVHGTVPIVKMDDVKAAQEITEHLTSLGHKDIGFVKGHPRHSASALRYEGFREAMRRAGLRINPDWIVEGDFTYKSGVEAGAKLLSGQNRPTAVFASNDDSAAGVMAIAGRLGLSIPADLSIAGFDDTAIADSIWPRLTTIRQPVSEMGYCAAKLLLDTQRDLDVLEHKLNHELIIRESTGHLKQ